MLEAWTGRIYQQTISSGLLSDLFNGERSEPHDMLRDPTGLKGLARDE